MEYNKISMMDAYMIETLRSHGTSNEEMTTLLETKDISDWKKKHNKFDFTELISLYEQDKQAFQSILQDGYTIKFLTINGLKNLLKMKFDKIAERDYQISGTGIQHLEIEVQSFPTLEQFLSINWVIREHADTINKSSTKIIDIQIV